MITPVKIRANQLTIVAATVSACILLFTFFKIAPHSPSAASSISTQIPLFTAPPVRNGLKVAYASFLSTRVTNESEYDPYFTASRVLAYQLLHHPVTKTRDNIPLLILVPPHVSEHKRKILASEGAQIVPVDLLLPDTPWLSPATDRYDDQFTKLRLFGLEQYDRILYVDNDMLLTRCLDPIFDEPAVMEVQTTGADPASIESDEAPLPSTYLFTGVSDTGGGDHPFPPVEGDDINGGFFLLRPDRALLAYYKSVLNIPNRFPSVFMEQSMLTYAHRRDGNMPWRAFEMGKWNTNWPNEKDVEGGTATLHDKFWDSLNKDWIDRKPVEMWWRMQGQMEGFWQGKRE
ncbi:nucleotide-diphospho-sugar transferase [Eremomyces bilateralis CBS 781.70]|uniref:Nucleotide-diphospho-sugar transferase n=1 Tax=Eremomyces bilateralis CBS 781.70 TaxID=1392243 RepID=A0A6G1GA19_9PEZI|nr:nucleotide-diphospho-sugar transferase [Eremomyces bilateralis CBS 781.70]KAF1814883.1 nucleotide-diphospho-sugar transferase [Eremomyces bilateralis CBS 781.70]